MISICMRRVRLLIENETRRRAKKLYNVSKNPAGGTLIYLIIKMWYSVSIRLFRSIAFFDMFNSLSFIQRLPDLRRLVF